MYTVRGESFLCRVDYIVTYLVVTCDDESTIRAAQRVMHRRGFHATVAFVLDIGGVNVVTSTLKIAKFRCGYYCTSNRGTPHAQTGTHMFGT